MNVSRKQRSSAPTSHSTAAPDGARPGRRRRTALVVIAALLAVVVGTASAQKAASPVGHWRSSSGHEEYLAAYHAAFADLPEPADTLDIRTSFGLVRVHRFATTRAATGAPVAPLVLLPGTRSATPVWADNLNDLMAIAEVYSVELLGEPGLSIQERPITSAADEAQWLHEVLIELPGEHFNLVGLSIGGWTAVNLALHHSGKVHSLTLVDPTNVLGKIPWGTALRSLPAAVPWFPKSWRDGFNSYTANGAPVEDVPVADMIELGMRHYSMRKPQPELVTPEQLESLSMPVLVLVAGRSVMHDDQADEVAERHLRQGAVRLHPEASHAINGEYPEQIAKDMADFLEATR